MDEKRIGLADAANIRNTRNGTTNVCLDGVISMTTFTATLIVGFLYLDEFSAAISILTVASTLKGGSSKKDIKNPSEKKRLFDN